MARSDARFAQAALLGFATLLLAALPARAAFPPSPITLGTPLRYLPSSSTGNAVRTVSDGAGGLIAVWVDTRNNATTGWDLYAQRLGASGTVMWTANGVPVTTATGTQGSGDDFDAIADGAGGVYVAWGDYRNGASSDIYAQHLDGTGARVWGVSDVPVCTATDYQYGASLASDNGGGVVIAWADRRNGTSYDIYARRVLANGTLSWTANGVQLVNDAAQQFEPRVVSVPGGGTIVTWTDQRASSGLYAQRLTLGGGASWSNANVACNPAPDDYDAVGDGAGGVVLAFTDDTGVNGKDILMGHLDAAGVNAAATSTLTLCDAAGDQSNPRLVRAADGTYFAVWNDNRSGMLDAYAQRFSTSGYCFWTLDGSPATSTANYSESATAILADTDGGMFVGLNANSDVFGQRLSATGSRRWGSSGTPVCLVGNIQMVQGLVADGVGGAHIVYSDYGSIGFSGVYAAHLDAYGQMLDARPAITKVKDALNDQGGQLVVQWSASALDGDATTPVSQYSVWRRVPVANVAALVAGAAFDEGGVASVGGRTIRRTGVDVLADYWEYVDALPAAGLPGYSMTVATTCDSTPVANPRTWFMVMALKSDGSHWDSAPDSGYSVDNLAPLTPAPFTGTYTAGNAALHWQPNHEADLAGYRIYRGTTAGFVANAGSLVAAVSDTGYADAAGAPYYYKLTAVDVHGNESPVATLQPAGTLDAPVTGAPRALELAPPSPNPVRAGGAVLRFALPAAAHARLALVDAQGREIARLADGAFAAGEHAVRLGESAPLAPGLYFAVLDAAGTRRVQRVAVVR